MIIKILGTGCPKCKLLQATVEEAVKTLNLDCKIIKVDDMQDIMEYDIMTLLDPNIRKEKRMKVMKIISFKAPYFDIKDKVVWGATAMIISEFKEILKTVVN